MRVEITGTDLIVYTGSMFFVVLTISVFLSILNIDDLTMYLAYAFGFLVIMVIAMFHQLSIGKRATLRRR